MAKRLNPKRRKELWERRMTTLLRPSTLTGEGTMRLNAGQLSRQVTLAGSSKGLARGLLAQEAQGPVYGKPKRRKAIKPALHVNPADLDSLHRPVKERLNAEQPKPKRTRRAGNKIVIVGKRPWSNS